MRVQSFDEMLLEYNINKLDTDDQEQRIEKLKNFPFSVIVEGGHRELENLEKWMTFTLEKKMIESLYYGKTGYDFGFAEYFFVDSISMENTIHAVPRIYTIYPHSLTPNKACRSLGYENEEVHDANDKTALIFQPKSEI